MVAEIRVDEAWEMLSNRPEALLVDVRTMAEWNFVGVPDLSSIDKEVRLVEWITFPEGRPNPSFVADASGGLSPDQPVLFLCRSGARSDAAARAFEAQGFTETFNVLPGFEGDLGADGHRDGGWKHRDLPWKQG